MRKKKTHLLRRKDYVISSMANRRLMTQISTKVKNLRLATPTTGHKSTASKELKMCTSSKDKTSTSRTMTSRRETKTSRMAWKIE